MGKKSGWWVFGLLECLEFIWCLTEHSGILFSESGRASFQVFIDRCFGVASTHQRNFTWLNFQSIKNISMLTFLARPTAFIVYRKSLAFEFLSTFWKKRWESKFRNYPLRAFAEKELLFYERPWFSISA